MRNRNYGSWIVIPIIIAILFCVVLVTQENQISDLQRESKFLQERTRIGSGQPLALRCEVEEYVGQAYDGYYFDENNKKHLADILEKSPEHYKINIIREFCVDVGEGLSQCYQFAEEGWIPKDEFYKYHTVQELSEIVNRLQGLHK